MHRLLPIVLLFLAAGKNWQMDPEWVRTRYGAWGGPGVNAAPGPPWMV